MKIEHTPWVYNQPKPTPNDARLPIHKERRAAAGKYSSIGWHDFRHTYRAMMRELKVSLEEQRTLMRHSDIRTTLGYGGKTPAEYGREANAKVVEMLRKGA